MNRQQVDAVVSKYTLLYHPECELHIFVSKFLLHPEHLITRTTRCSQTVKQCDGVLSLVGDKEAWLKVRKVRGRSIVHAQIIPG